MMTQIKEKNVACEIYFFVHRFSPTRTQYCQLFQKATAYLVSCIS